MDNIIICIETSFKTASIALFDGKNLVDGKIFDSEVQPSTYLLEYIEKLLTENKIEKKRVKSVAVCTGPGNFTGLRVGISIAEGLAFGLDANLYGIPFFDILDSLDKSDIEDDAISASIVSGGKNLFCLRLLSGHSEKNRIIIVNDTEILELFRERKISAVNTEERSFEKMRGIRGFEYLNVTVNLANENLAEIMGYVLLKALRDKLLWEVYQKSIKPLYLREAL